ncbi:hypothetical protein DSM03_1011073 [Leeuwenhoekiella aestuarii]|uniref:Uncharacterized protein n=1 Tax=Leeuwenhoekiella aestuarii TaxID=2249426 RepID=A0A4Q0P088_9FLAO|nr:hypothetical protein DSM04_101584 [Leeuwenhoekiella aestuarii]RXG19696.1 hypothetical protein DSM03_1011073 [Leeuwenhoekiella aestuarii]
MKKQRNGKTVNIIASTRLLKQILQNFYSLVFAKLSDQTPH